MIIIKAFVVIFNYWWFRREKSVIPFPACGALRLA